MAKIPKKRKWPKGLPKPNSARYKALIRRKAENEAIDKKIEAARKALGK